MHIDSESENIRFSANPGGLTHGLNGNWFLIQRILAAIMLVMVAPLLGVFFVLVKSTSRGPFIYRQVRPGLRGKPFRALKIRSMEQGADVDKALARSVQSSNSKVTPVGRVLRDLKLDELPQLWNVVKGDMVFVGPRPIAVSLQQELESEIPGFARRLTVRPGITNLGQVCVLESAAPEQVVADWRIRFESELHYLKNRSPSYDVIIMLMTMLYILRKLGSRIWQNRQSPLKALGLLTLVVVVLGLAGCAGTGGAANGDRSSVQTEYAYPADTGGDLDSLQVESVNLDAEIQSEPEPHYLVGPVDVLSVNIFGEPGMDSLRVPVDADGYIQLPVIEKARVVGKTTSEIQDQLKVAFASEFNNPWVVVLVAEYGSKPLYLLGEFNSPGVIYLNRPTNILQAMGHGNGLTERAYLRGARLLREDKLVPVDINGLLKEGHQDQNLWLKAGDTIYVPDIREQKVIILGAVNNPMTLPINNDGMGLVELLARAEGIRRGVSRLDQVRIIRSLSPVKGEFITINAEHIFAGVSPDFPLRPGDIVYVPQNALGNWNDVIAAIKPSFELVTDSLQPFVQLKFLTDSN